MSLATLVEFKLYKGITSIDDDVLNQSMLDSATSAIETYCNRIFALTSYREYHDGGGSEINLRNFPIVTVTLLGVWREAAFGIQNTSSDAYNAQVSISETEIQLQVFGGVNEDNTSLTLASYSTMSDLFIAINALNKGWSITEITGFNFWSPSELLPTGKGLQCKQDVAEPQIPSEPESDFTTDTTSGILKYFGCFCEGFQNITVRYSAGYAAIPADLVQICIDLTCTYFDASKSKMNSNMKKEKIGDYEYETGGTAQIGATSATGIPSTIAGRLNGWATRA